MGVDRVGDRFETEGVLFGWTLYGWTLLGWTIEQAIRAIAVTVELVTAIFLNDLEFTVSAGKGVIDGLRRQPSFEPLDTRLADTIAARIARAKRGAARWCIVPRTPGGGLAAGLAIVTTAEPSIRPG